MDTIGVIAVAHVVVATDLAPDNVTPPPPPPPPPPTVHWRQLLQWISDTQSCSVYPKKYAHGFCFAVRCCGYTLTEF